MGTNLALLLAALALTFIAVEALVRVAFTDGSNFDIEMWRYARELKRVSAVPGVGHEHVPGGSGTFMGVAVSINRQGLRGRDLATPKPPGTVRILMLGDSVTFGWGAAEEDTTSAALEKLLNAGGGEIAYEVVNAGVGNTNTAMQVAYLNHGGLQLQPDVVILNYFINDAEPTPTRKSSWLMENSYAAVFLAGRLDIVMRRFLGREDWKAYYGRLYDEQADGWRTAKASIEALARTCRERGIALLVAHYPELHQLRPYPFSPQTELVRAAVAGASVPFVDLLASVENEDPVRLWVTSTDAHPNSRAAEKFAALLAERLRELFPQHFPRLD